MGAGRVYVDTSIFLKLFIQEKGSDKARKLLMGKKLISSAVLLTECFSALSRKHHADEISSETFHSLELQLRHDSTYMEIVRLTDNVLEKAEEITLHTSCRSLDALHIAAAKIVTEDTKMYLPFFTSDKKQFETVKSLGLNAILIG